MLLLCGCAKTDNKTEAEGQQDTAIAIQQSDISQWEYQILDRIQ